MRQYNERIASLAGETVAFTHFRYAGKYGGMSHTKRWELKGKFDGKTVIAVAYIEDARKILAYAGYRIIDNYTNHWVPFATPFDAIVTHDPRNGWRISEIVQSAGAA